MNRLLTHAQALHDTGHPVALVGDYNVVPTDFDIYNTRSWSKNALLQPEPRALYQRLLGQGWIDAIKTTLSEAVERSAGLAAADLKGEKKSGLRVHGRAGQECAVCGDTIKEVSFADSSLQYCPTCQTGGKPLADRRLSRLLK